MFIKTIVFTLGSTMPLAPLTGLQSDEYANVKPETSITVGFADGECDPDTVDGENLIGRAYEHAENIALEQLASFRTQFRAMITGNAVE